MRKHTKWAATLFTTLASIIVFIISLCSIGSDSWLPIIALCGSGLGIMFGLTQLDDWGAEDVCGKDR